MVTESMRKERQKGKFELFEEIREIRYGKYMYSTID